MSGRDKLLNIGPKSTAWLRQVGIRSAEELQAAGSVGAFVKVRRAGFKPSLNLLYALEGALTGVHWQQVPAERRSEMLLAVDAAEAMLPKARGRMAAFVERQAAVDPDAGGSLVADLGFDDPAADSGAGEHE